MYMSAGPCSLFTCGAWARRRGAVLTLGATWGGRQHSPGGSRRQGKNPRQQPSADLGHQGKTRKVGEGTRARQQRTIGWW